MHHLHYLRLCRNLGRSWCWIAPAFDAVYRCFLFLWRRLGRRGCFREKHGLRGRYCLSRNHRLSYVERAVDYTLVYHYYLVLLCLVSWWELKAESLSSRQLSVITLLEDLFFSAHQWYYFANNPFLLNNYKQYIIKELDHVGQAGAKFSLDLGLVSFTNLLSFLS